MSEKTDQNIDYDSSQWDSLNDFPASLWRERAIYQEVRANRITKQLEIAKQALVRYAEHDSEIIKVNELEKWLAHSKARPEAFQSGILYQFGLTKRFASKALEKIEECNNESL